MQKIKKVQKRAWVVFWRGSVETERGFRGPFGLFLFMVLKWDEVGAFLLPWKCGLTSPKLLVIHF